MSAKDWKDFADNLVTDFGVEFGNGSANPQGYHVIETKAGGTSPIDPPIVVTEDFPINLVMTNISRSLIDGTLIKQGDSGMVVTKYETQIQQGDTIKYNGNEYVMITKDPAAPYGDSIVQKLIVRVR